VILHGYGGAKKEMPDSLAALAKFGWIPTCRPVLFRNLTWGQKNEKDKIYQEKTPKKLSFSKFDPRTKKIAPGQK